MKPLLGRALLLAGVLAVIGCFPTSRFDYARSLTSQAAILMTELASLNLEAPEKDVERNFSHKDYRCIRICGIGCYSPGIPPDSIFCKRFGSRIIEGTSDMVESEEHIKLMKVAQKYATTYNQVLIKRLAEADASKGVP